MPENKDYFYLRTGIKWDNFGKDETLDDIAERRLKQTKSRYPLRLLGVGKENHLWISEEERDANYHIIGQPRQGKSKFIEYSIRKDIDMGNGLCLLDPSDNGDTAKKILKYCALKGVEKVVYIDPDTLWKYGKIATLQPLKPCPYTDQSVNSVMEAVGNVFGVARETDTPRIRRNLSSLLTVLVNQGLTLYETKYFRRWSKDLPFLGDDEDSMIIKEAFRSPFSFETFFLSTVGRLDTFRKEPLSLITGSNTGIDFIKMVKEGWVILVNLYPHNDLSITQARLLGILIIAEIIHAMSALFRFEPSGQIKHVFYLYMDEAARFATSQIKELLDYRGKIGLRFILAHHYFSQFKDKDILDAIKQGCRIKMMFNMSSYKDRVEMCEDLGYGGDIHPILAAYANKNIPKREMVITKDKEAPVRIRVPDVQDVNIPKDILDDYTKKILDQPWYLTKKQIQDQIDARSIRTYIQSPQSRKVDESETTRSSDVSRPLQGKLEKGIRPSNKKSPESPPKRPIKI